jgi:hypothetical protein
MEQATITINKIIPIMPMAHKVLPFASCCGSLVAGASQFVRRPKPTVKISARMKLVIVAYSVTKQ